MCQILPFVENDFLVYFERRISHKQDTLVLQTYVACSIAKKWPFIFNRFESE